MAIYFMGEKEQRAMREARLRAINDAREVLFFKQSSVGPLDEDELASDTLTGIENLLTPSMIKKTLRCRERCFSAVFKEQTKQIESGCYDPERIAYASRLRSAWSVKRAEEIGHQQHNSSCRM